MKRLLAGVLVAGLFCVGCNDPAGTQPARSSTGSTTSQGNTADAGEILAALNQIGDAFQKFHAAHGAMPPAAIFSTDGKPLLSWRVALLPYLNEDALYQQFKLDEPWDSQHNRPLLAKMPSVYAPRRGPTPAEPYSTYYQVFTGKDAPFNLTAGLVAKADRRFEGTFGPRFADVTDGTAQTFLVVEASQAVRWTQPSDLVYDAGKPLPSLGFGDRFYLALFDGSAHFMKKSEAEDVIRGGITPHAQIVRPSFEGKQVEPVLYSDERTVLDRE
jgi:hypothetical protein